MSRFAPPEAVVLMMMESDDYPMHIGAMQLFRPPVGVDDLARQMYDAMLTQTDVEAMFARGRSTPFRARR